MVFDVVVENAGQRSGKAGDVCSALPCGDIVDIGIDGFGIAIVPLHRHFKFDRAIVPSFDAMDIDRVWEKRNFIFIEIGDKGDKPAFIAEVDIVLCLSSRSSRK